MSTLYTPSRPYSSHSYTRQRKPGSFGISNSSTTSTPQPRAQPPPASASSFDHSRKSKFTKRRKGRYFTQSNPSLNVVAPVCCCGVVLLFIFLLFLYVPSSNTEIVNQQQQQISKPKIFNRRNQREKLKKIVLPHPHDPNVVHDDWERGPWSIFFNIYIPKSDNEDEVTFAIDILKEQLDQIAKSPACTRQSVTLYYTLIGNANALDASAMQRLCLERSPNLHCRLLQTRETGSEEVTLRRVHAFCKQNPDFRITYLHTKGSFHYSEKNTNWRRLLTAAAVSPDCVRPPDDTCNLCGLTFYTQFTFFIPGNMYTAHCSYIRKLLPFENGTYQQARDRAVTNILLLKLRNQLRNNLLRDQLDYYGMDRYRNEHWVGSHPDIIPCDMDPVGSLLNVFEGVLQESEFKWAMGPRNQGICGGISDDLQPDVRQHVDKSRREILFLPGLLVKWFTLYGRPPNPDSWIWSSFPDGKFWLNGVQRYGDKVVEKLNENYYFAADGAHIKSAFALKTANHTKTKVEGLDSMLAENEPKRYEDFNTNLEIDESSAQKIAFFYHIGIPNARDGTKITDDDVQTTLDMIKQQFEIVKDSHVASQSNLVTLFYTISGHEDLSVGRTLIDLVQRSCVDANLQCRSLLQFDQNYEGETLRQLHRFCHRYPTYRVSYFHNQAPVQLRNEDGNQNLIRHMTKAVTNELCLEMDSESCNVCGLIFFTTWTFFFPGNFFVASCEYVNRLLKPETFEERMESFIRDFMLRRLRLQITTSLFQDRMDFLGLDRYAMDHWVGSHPSIKPCDLSKSEFGIQYWRALDSHTQPSPFDFALAPRQKGAPFDMNWIVKEHIAEDEAMRIREYTYLAGLLLRWYFLYGEGPEPVSWIWMFFPDGLKWLSNSYKHGSRVVDEMTAEYAKDIY